MDNQQLEDPVSNSRNTGNYAGAGFLKGFGQLFNEAWSLFKKKAVVLIGIYIIPLLWSLITAAVWLYIFRVMRPSDIESVVVFSDVPVRAFSVLVSIFSGLALMYAVSGNCGVRESYKKAIIESFGKYLWLIIVAGLVTLGGFVMGIIPGFIFLVWFVFAYYVFVVEDKRGISAILRSKEYVTGYWWRVFFRLLLLLLVFIGAGIIVFLSKFINIYLEIVLIYTLDLIAVPLIFTFVFVLYKNLTEIKPQVMSAPVSGNKKFFKFSGWLGLLALITLEVLVYLINLRR